MAIINRWSLGAARALGGRILSNGDRGLAGSPRPTPDMLPDGIRKRQTAQAPSFFLAREAFFGAALPSSFASLPS
ncbi:MAG: hypothetical protein KF735_24790, partial [Chelatococcus sp.]|uniref:hypothetical protein n=1 Tax=Chelatococcus sp. TaxID=1953771 RepID=UPI0025BF1B26